ncbi:MAG TPA: ABC transporter ATP-binding protein [Terriglobia bacterium]|nr:ABC transporter ATP-binding protein [Terriglobia bacterium]
MSEIAIRAENLSKRYQIGEREQYTAFRDVLSHALSAPARMFRRHKPQSSNGDATHIWALKDVSFEIRRGEVVGIIGRNGAGKSTLLKILARVTKPTSGCADVQGRMGSLLEVGTGFHPELTGRENTYLNGAILGMSKKEVARKFDEIVAFAEVEKFIDTPVKHYSSGMYLRLAFAVAAHLETEILLVDEVLAVGDAGFQKKCLGKIGEVSRGGRSVVFVSHNMAAISQLCESAIWLREGRVGLVGPPEQVVAAYLLEGSERCGDRHWPDVSSAPGDDRVRLLRARLAQQGECMTVIDINKPFQVEVQFQALRELRNLISGINLYNQHGVCLFGSCDWRPNHLSPGRYSKSVQLPAHLLAEGPTSVLVQLVFYDPDVRSVVLPDTLAFDAVESNHPGAVRGDYKGAWPGLVRIALPWSDANIVSERADI